MNCEQFDWLIDEFIDDRLAAAEDAAIHEHLQRCSRCADALAEHHRYLAAMRSLPSPGATPGRLAHMLRQAHLQGELAEQRRSPRGAFLAGFATAAALALVVLAHQWPHQSAQSPAAEAAVLAIADQTLKRQVTVVINVPADMPTATLALDFPGSLRMEGLEDLGHVAWSVNLEQGANVLTLPLTVAAGTDLAAPQTIQATVRYEDREKIFDLPVELLVDKNPLQGTLFAEDSDSVYHI